MRKSSRSRKPVEFYLPTNSILNKIPKTVKEDEEENEEENEEEDEEEESEEKEESENEEQDENENESEDEEKTNNKTKNKTNNKTKNDKKKENTKRVVNKKSEKVNNQVNQQTNTTPKKGRGKAGEYKNILFDSFQTKKYIKGSIEKWIRIYQDSRVRAISEMTNFLLLVAGASSKRWLQPSIDIDGLSTEELEETLIESINMIRTLKNFPMLGTTNKAQAIRNNFDFFWENLATALLTVSDRTKVLSSLAELLLSLSSSTVSSIRDVATESALVFGRILLKATIDLRIKEKESKHQLSVSGREMGAKQKSILSFNKETQKSLRELDEIIVPIYETVFTHRSKDVVDIIRHRSVYHLGEWILTDPERWIDDDYLKFIGWMTSDRSSTVRLEAVQILSKIVMKADYVARLVPFCERFVPRIVEMAAADIDELISFNAVKLMRKFQICGLLDSISQSTIDLVDRIVFDSSSSLRVRGEALAFMMDHTEGFDETDQNDIEETIKENSSKKGRRSSKSKLQHSSQDSNEVRALAKKKRIIFQLETLAEFADYHLKLSNNSNNNNMSYINLLSEACLLKRPKILRDWDNILKLIIRNDNDEDDDINSQLHSQELNSVNVSIILRLCSQSAQSLKHQYLNFQQKDSKKRRKSNSYKNNNNNNNKDNGDEDENNNNNNNNNNEDNNEEEIITSWNELQDSLQSSVVLLLTHFRSDEIQLESALELLECLEVSSIDGKDLKKFIKSFMDLFETIQSETILSKMGKVLRFWVLKESTQQKSIINSIKELFENCWTKVSDLIQSLSTLETNDDNDKQPQPEKRKRGRLSNSKTDKKSRDLLNETIPAIKKLSILWKSIDCRSFISQPTEEMSSTLSEGCILLVNTFNNSTWDVSLVTIVSEYLGQILFNLLLWETRDLYIETSSLNEEEEEYDSNIAKNYQSQIETILNIREILEKVLGLWMDLETDTIQSHQLQCEAFRVIGDLRKLFPLKETNYYIVDELAWKPSSELFRKLESVFKTEEIKIKDKLNSLTDSKKDQIRAQKLIRELVENLLWPLSCQMYDVENLNRGQAAAILNYIVDETPEIQNIVRGYIKSLKETNFSKYLEAIIIALKKSYEQNVIEILEKLSQVSHQEENELNIEDSESDLLNELNENLNNTIYFATKLSQSLGIGKLKSSTDELVLFFKVGLEQAFSNINYFGFLRVLEVFLKLLPDSNLLQVGEYYDKCVDSISDEIRKFIGDHINIGGNIEEFSKTSLQSFSSHLSHLASGGKTKRKTFPLEIKKKDTTTTTTPIKSTPIKSTPKKESTSSIRSKRKNDSPLSSDQENKEVNEEVNTRLKDKKSPKNIKTKQTNQEKKVGKTTNSSPLKDANRRKSARLNTPNKNNHSNMKDESDEENEIEANESEEEINSPAKKSRRITPDKNTKNKTKKNDKVVDDDNDDDDDGHWGNPDIDISTTSQPVLGLHLEDFGNDFDNGGDISSTKQMKSLKRHQLDSNNDFDSLPTRRRR